MKRHFPALLAFAIGATPVVSHAQGFTMHMTTTVAPDQEKSQNTQDNTTNVLQQLVGADGSDGKHPVIVLDSVRVSEEELANFAKSLQTGKVRIRKDGVRILQGDTEEAKKYGAGSDAKVIMILTEPVSKPQQ